MRHRRIRSGSHAGGARSRFRSEDGWLIRWAFRLAQHFGKLDPYRDVLGAIDRRLLVEWIAFFQLEPMPADRSDHRSTLHTAHLMGCLAEDVDEDIFETLWPSYFDEPAPETEVDDEAKSHQLAATILAHFAG